MKFLVMYTPDPSRADTPPDPSQAAAMRAYAERMSEAGTLISQGMIDPTAARVRLQAGHSTVEQVRVAITGYAYIEARSLEEAIEGAKEFLTVAGDGMSEVRLVSEAPPQAT